MRAIATNLIIINFRPCRYAKMFSPPSTSQSFPAIVRVNEEGPAVQEHREDATPERLQAFRFYPADVRDARRI